MLKTTIIELREKTSLNEYDNGHYKINLNEPVYLSEGDEIGINNVFLDTKGAQNEKIIIADDINCKFSFCYYITNWKKGMIGEYAGTRAANSAGAFVKPDLNQISNEIYIGCNTEIQNGAHDRITQILVQPTGLSKNWGNLTLTFTYKDNHNKTHNYSFKLPTVANKYNDYIKNVNILCNPNTFINTNTAKELSKASIYQITYTQGAENHGKFTPHIEELDFILPKGEYLPNELTTYLNLQFNRNDYLSNIDNLLLNPLIEDITAKVGDLITPNGDLPCGLNFVKHSGDTILLNDITGNDSKAAQPVYIGTNNVVFNYDNNENIFKIQFLHMPKYDTNGNIIIDNLKYTAQNGDDHYVQSLQHSGILFTHIETLDSTTGEEINFFTERLGFDLADLCANFEYKNLDFEAYNTSNYINFALPYIPNLKRGVNFTENIDVIDNIVKKDIWPKIPTMPDLPFSSTSNETYEIKATNITNELLLNTGYFLIDISGIGINNRVIGQNMNSTSIRGIVGRYYNVGSGTNTYTSGGAETSINYIHYGEPVIINSFTVKILDSEGNESPQDLGPDNSIFLNVINKIEFEEPKK